MKTNNLTHYAAIDIGSNAVRLLIKNVAVSEIKPLFRKVQLIRIPLRLGDDAFVYGKISEEKEKQLTHLMKAYKEIMEIYEVEEYRACGTSAMRDAANGNEVVARIEQAAGVKIDIIDGKEEARLILNNSIEQIYTGTGTYLYVDVGGGSTELNLIDDGVLKSSSSYDIGTVRMINNTVDPLLFDMFRHDLIKIHLLYPSIKVIGSGGNINKLIRLSNAPQKDTPMLSISHLKDIYKELRNLTTEERMNRFRLKPDRADVIIPAAEIFLEIAKYTDTRFIIVPTIGLSDGIIDDIFSKNQQPASSNNENQN